MATKAKPKRKPKKRAVLPLKKIKRKRVLKRTIQTEPKMNDNQRADLAPETERKLSAKIIVGKRIGQVTEAKDLFTVIGIATGTRSGQSNYGEWTGLKGQFEVVRCDDGKVLRAPIMILPDAAMAELTGNGLDYPLQFGFLVRVVPSINDAGFEYEVIKVVDPANHDPLEDLRVQFASNRVQVGHGG